MSRGGRWGFPHAPARVLAVSARPPAVVIGPRPTSTRNLPATGGRTRPSRKKLNALRKLRSALRILKLEGFDGLRYRLKHKLREELATERPPLPVKAADALAVDWTREPSWRAAPRAIKDGPLTIAWVMSPPSENSGGHQNLFRFLDYAEKAGHRCKIYFYTSAPVVVNTVHMRSMLEASSGYRT